jgi:methionine aminotransferase
MGLNIISKLPEVGSSIFSIMSKMAADYGAINLAQGFPNFEVDPRLTAILKEQAQENIHQYTPMAGLPGLLEAIQTQVEGSYGRILDVSKELLVTAGATQGIFTVFQALVQMGDEVIILDPAYDCYAPAIKLAGGKAVHIELLEDFTPNWNLIEEKITNKTKMLLFNNPHNPSGKVWTVTDFEALEMLLEKHPQLIVFADEVYEYIVFEHKHISVNERPKLKERSIVCSSFGKTYHITGWKTGYLVAPETMMNEIKKVHQYLVFSVNSVAQNALKTYIPMVSPADLSLFYMQKRDLFQTLLKDSRFELLPSEGSYFQLARYTEISAQNDVDFSAWLTKEIGVASIPISPFYKSNRDDKIIRFCYAKTDETLILAADKLCKI